MTDLHDDYRSKHADPTNVLWHFSTVPVAVAAILTALACAWFPAAAALAVGLALAFLIVDLRAGLVLAAALALLLAVARIASLASPLGAALGALLALPLAIGLQGVGHRREAVRTRFAGPLDVMVRLTREQLYLAPLFLATRLVKSRRVVLS